MHVTKLGHCALVIEENGAKLLTDPGMFTTASQEILTGVNGILITHEHEDHFHLPSLKIVLKHNPRASVVCNSGVAVLLSAEGIAHTIVAHQGHTEVEGISIEGFGTDHAVIHSSWPLVANTGFFIGGRLWYPGDAFFNPGMKPDILALPVGGPWMKISEAVDYAIELSPKTVIPVHDAVLSESGIAIHHRIVKTILESNGIQFISTEIGKTYNF